jgi:hypothetical protein
MKLRTEKACTRPTFTWLEGKKVERAWREAGSCALRRVSNNYQELRMEPTQWIKPVIPAPQKVDIRRIPV